MLEIKDKSKCSGCYACANICPKDCLKMEFDDEGFWYPNIDTELCIDCGMCEKVCPILHNNNLNEGLKFQKVVYSAQNLNNAIRMNSSSGGIFTSLAEEIINLNGEVVGVGFNEYLEVVHKSINKLNQIDELRGSKYVQSKVGNIHKDIKKNLNEDKIVYFSGTPCQIAGLETYLNKKYDNLITQDIVCHGVPSPILFEKYKQYVVSSKNEKINNIFFRDKSEGWRRYSLKFEFERNKIQRKNIEEDLYLISFQNNISLRPSCYECKFKGEQRQSDITLADFWGVENSGINMDDNKGTSLVIINTDKGKELFDKIKSKIVFKEVGIREALYQNKSYYESANKNEARLKFLKEITAENYKKKVREYCNFTYKKEIKTKIKNTIKTLIKK